MNDQQFIERAHANPHDESPDFLDAIAQGSERQELVASLKKFDAALSSGLKAVSAPETLKNTLLNISEETINPDTSQAAANDSFWRRNARYAAGFIVALGVLAAVIQNPSNAWEDMIFSHIYSEISFLDDNTPITLSEVNGVMKNLVGTDFITSAEMDSLEINVTKDCWVDLENGIQGVHLVMKGNAGPVTVMVIPNTPVDREMTIADERFSGLVSPGPGGNLVVVGEKNEAIQQYSTMLAANINW